MGLKEGYWRRLVINLGLIGDWRWWLMPPSAAAVVQLLA
jgi:hypothetical protein